MSEGIEDRETEQEQPEVNEEAGSVAETAELSPEELVEELERLRAEKDDQFDQLIRLKAEFENYKKRVEREIQDRARRAEEQLVRRLLSALDSLDRALAQPMPEGDVGAVWEGLKQIRQQFHDGFAALGVATIETVGTRFDPYYHEALFTVESDEHEENAVVDELERGYTLRGKVIRPAKVTVNIGGKPNKTESGNEEQETDKKQHNEAPTD